ncbi:MAG: tRNA lysidine(34) synthetase TilS [Alphaproteobacteria bacterium]
MLDIDRYIPESCLKIGIAVSGGPDSMVLAALLQKWQRTHRPEITLRCCIIDHHLRAESTHEARKVQASLHKMGLDADIVTAKQPFSPHIKASQAMARMLRYDLLDEWAANYRLDALALGHHQDDQIETIAMRLIRDSGFRGLRAMQPCHENANSVLLLRPLLDKSKAQLYHMVKALNLEYVEDPSNHNLTYERVVWRALLNQPVNASLQPQLLRLGAVSLKFTAFEDRLFDQITAQALIARPHALFAFNPAQLAAYGDLIAQNWLRHYWHHHSMRAYPPKRHQTARIYNQIMQTDRGGCLHGLRWQRLAGGIISVRNEKT